MTENAQPTLALAMILKDEEDVIEETLDSVLPFVDAFYLTDTGSTDKTIEICEKKALQYNVKFDLSHFEWIKDFAAARNYNFDQVKEDYIIWLDADDTLRGGEKIRDYLVLMRNKNVHGLGINYNYNFDELGQVTEAHYKEQIVENSDWGKWVGRIHETILADGPAKLVKIDDVWRDHRTTAERQAKSTERNIEILLEVLEEEREAGEPDPRTLFLLANAQLAQESYEEALQSLDEYLKLSGWDEERYQAYMLVAETMEKLGETDAAHIALLEATKERPDFPDAYFGIARLYFEKSNWDKCLTWTDIGYQRGKPDTNIITFPQEYTWKPALIAATAAVNKENLTLAQKYLAYAAKHRPNDEGIREMYAGVMDALQNKGVAEAYIKILRQMEKSGDHGKIPVLLNNLPKTHLSDPILSQIKSQYVQPKTWEDNSVVIFCPHSAEPFSPKSAERGIGGSEEAVINLSKRWQKMGYDVTVFNYCDEEAGNYDGVEWKNYWEFNPNDEYNILIGWRVPSFFASKYSAKKRILDLHDVPFPMEYTDEIIENIDHIFVKTNYHRTFLPAIPDEKFVVVGNGIDPDHFTTSVNRIPHKVIYSSSPDRGLEHLLAVWPEVVEAVPDAELNIFYGWESFKKMRANNPERMAWMEKMQKLIATTPNITDHGRVNHQDLANEYLSAGVWAYPTDFEEIHCITACKAQASGAIPVVTNYAALKETVVDGIKVDGDPWSQEYRDEYTQKLIEALDSKWDRKGMSLRARDMFDWQKVAETWAEYF